MVRKILLTLVLIGLLPSAGIAQSEVIRRGGNAIAFPARTTDGNFDGTWYYASRDHRMGLFIRTVDGEPQLQMIYRSNRFPESFDTDWNGRAEYLVAGRPCGFEFKKVKSDENAIHGEWRWITTWSGREREIFANVEIHRTGDGRQLVIRFPDKTRTLREESGDERVIDSPESWSFRKISRRIVRVEELPF